MKLEDFSFRNRKQEKFFLLSFQINIFKNNSNNSVDEITNDRSRGETEISESLSRVIRFRTTTSANLRTEVIDKDEVHAAEI